MRYWKREQIAVYWKQGMPDGVRRLRLVQRLQVRSSEHLDALTKGFASRRHEHTATNLRADAGVSEPSSARSPHY